MKSFRFILKLFRNKYLLTTAVFAAWLLFFDKNDLFSQIDRHHEVMKVQSEVDYYKSEVNRNRSEQEQLESDPKQLERFAREHYLMKRDSEEIYVLVRDTLM